MRDAEFDDDKWMELQKKVEDAEKFFNLSKGKKEKLQDEYDKENSIKEARVL